MYSVNEIRAEYGDDLLVEAAQRILGERLMGENLASPSVVKNYVHVRLSNEAREHFMVIFLSSQNTVIKAEILFSGTLTETSVYPREVVRRALELNASAVILAHNHPSGVAEPSRADEFLTLKLKEALQLIDVRILDHMVVAKGVLVTSFAERGLL